MDERGTGLAAEVERLRDLVDSSPVGVVVSDGAGVVRDLNPAWTDLLRADPAAVPGRVLHEIHPAWSEVADLPAVLAALAADGRYEQEGWVPRFDGTRFWARTTWTGSLDAQGEPVLVCQVQDHDEAHRARAALAHAARHDALTGLPNREGVLGTLQDMVTSSTGGPERVGVLFCDLDRFEVVNDSLGHSAGDELLVAVAGRLQSGLREGDHVGRLGGDEFAVLLGELTGPQDAIRVADRLRAALAEDIDLAGHPVRCGISIGIALSDPDGPPATAAGLLRDAATAVHRAKHHDRGGFQLFAPAMHEEAVARLELEDDLRRAVEQDEFVVHYQPIARLEDGQRMAFEALVRWQHPERGTLGPETFLDAATECGLAPAIDSSVLTQVATFMVAHPTEIVAVNVSAQRLDGTFGDAVARALARVGAAGYRLMVELRESALLTDDTLLAAELHDLESLGVTVVVDDFGTGSSILTSLHELPIRGLKMGTAFTAGLPGNRRMVASILGLADGLDVECIATGVETAEQAQFLREAGWHAAQGWFFGGVAPEAHWFPVALPLD